MKTKLTSATDGGVNPPKCYFSHEEITNTLRIWNPTHPMLAPKPAAVPAENLVPDSTTSAVEVPIDPALLEVAAPADPSRYSFSFESHCPCLTMLYSFIEPCGSSGFCPDELLRHREISSRRAGI